jgi:hypothetical protein
MTACAFGDGSAVLVRQRIDPFDITVFAEHTPLTVGQSNLSVMVQRAADHGNVPDAQVTLRFRENQAGKMLEVMAPATHAKATNKVLYGAIVTLPNPGEWKFEADVTAQGSTVTMPATLSVTAEEPALKEKWPLLVFVPLAIVMFFINQRLRRRWRSNLQARP